MLIGPDEEGSIGTNLLILGVILLAVALLPPFIFGLLFAGQSAEDAWDDVSGDIISDGDPVKFHGRINRIDQGPIPSNTSQLYVEGFDDPVYFNNSETLSVGDEVIVDGYYNRYGIYYNRSGRVTGTPDQRVPSPASVSPRWGYKGWFEISMWIGVSLVIVGVALVAFRVRAGKRVEDFSQEIPREEDDRRDSKKRKRIGWVVDYAEKTGIAAIQMEKGKIDVGDKILFKGDTTDFSQKIATMTIGKRIARDATKGQVIEIKAKKRVRPNDIVYKIV
ncbi:MAG: hypothetical protein ACE5IO_03285 [Thermoplasmata archaeon]